MQPQPSHDTGYKLLFSLARQVNVEFVNYRARQPDNDL